MTDMTEKQRMFVQEYLIDLNATQAAIRAGYSENSAAVMGCENLTKPYIQEAIAAAQKERSERTQITADKVLTELAKIGFSDIRKVVQWGETQFQPDEDGNAVAYHGITLKHVDDVDEDTAAAIAEVSQGREGLKVKMYDKKAALVDIGRHLGMFKDKVELTGANGTPLHPVKDLTTEELAAELEKLGVEFKKT